jgi:predicted HicB family RNase H-like nuclease
MEKRKRLGRPTKPPTSGERTPLGLRVAPEIKRKLEAAAMESGRSLSQEAELRLERSFEHEFLLKSLQAWLKKEIKK